MEDLDVTATMTPTPAPTAARTPTAAAESETPANPHGLTRLRIVLLFVGYVVIGAASAAIFDQFQWALVGAAAPVTVAALVFVGWSSLVRTVIAAVAIAATVAIVVVVTGGGFGDFIDAFSSGIQGLLSTEWPSPASSELIATVAAVIATACAISAELAAHRRFHLLPLVPLVVAYVGVVGLSAPRGIQWTGVILLGAVSTCFALLRDDGSLHDRLVILRGERRMIPLLLIAVVIVALVSIPVTLTARADPRRKDPPQQTAPLLDPIQAMLALRDLDPPIDLHVITPQSDTALPGRWRSAALASYDGQRWSPSLTLRPIGRTLGPVIGPVADVSISFLDPNTSLVPLPGAPVSIDVPVETDLGRTVVRLVDRPDGSVRLVANIAPSASDAIDLGIVPRLVDESTSGWTDLARGLAGDGSALDQLTQLETTMREDFVLDPQVQGGGLQQALIDRFLRDTQRGTAEQFATSFVLLARSLGIEARVATGFDANPGERTSNGSLTLESADASVWPEVQLTDGRWLAFDPVPAEEASDGAPPPPEPQVQSPAAPQPPIAPPPDPDTDTTTDDDDAVSESTGSAIVEVALRVGVAAAIVLLPFAIIAGAIVGVKLRRRRRRLRAADPRDRIRGAWASATDVLVDAGLTISHSRTDAEIAVASEPLVGSSRRDARRLATLASAATYGAPEHPELLADDAARCFEAVTASLASSKTRWQRLRWRLSLRSLRRSTRSPVTG